MPITIDLRENALVKDLIEEIELELQQEKAERQQAEQERLQAEQKAEQEQQRINNIILALYHEFQMPIEQIARMANQDSAYIEDLIARAAASDDEN